MELTASVIKDNISTASKFSDLLRLRRQRIDDCLSQEDLRRLTIDGVTALCDYYGAYLPEGGSSMLVGAKAYIQENYARKLCLSELADHVHYIANLRIEQAKLSLRTSTDTVQSIAEAVGYPDAHYFSRVFKRLVGTSPMEYRRQAARETDLQGKIG